MKIIKWFFNRWYRWFPVEMVNYWLHGDVTRAKLVHAKDGSYIMLLEGEKYPYPGFPRGHILFGPLARFKHKVKNLVFNDTWAKLEAGEDRVKILTDLKGKVMAEIIKDIENILPDMLPPEKMCPAVRELYRAMSVVEKLFRAKQFVRLKQGITFFLQEDDAYRFRFQWASKFLRYYSWFRKVDIRVEVRRALKLVEYAEIVPDMKGRITLIARIVELLLEDDEINNYINAVIKEIDFKKIKLSKADRYYFRGKYYKVDHLHYDY